MNTNKSIINSEVLPLDETDNKEVINHICFFFKLMNFGLFMPTTIIIGIAHWDIANVIFKILALLFLIGNGILFAWYWLTMRKFRNPNKIVLTVLITDKKEKKGENPGTYIYFGSEEIDISNHFPGDEIEIGNNVKLHYFQKTNNKKGSLIKIEKI